MIVCDLIFVRCILNHRLTESGNAPRWALNFAPPKTCVAHSSGPFRIGLSRVNRAAASRFRCKGLIIDPAIVALPRLNAAHRVAHRKRTFREKACASDRIDHRIDTMNDLSSRQSNVSYIMNLVDTGRRKLSLLHLVAFLLIVKTTGCYICTDTI